MYRAMIVDDHPIIRLAVGMLLEKENIEVVGEAGNGQDAIRMARELEPDVVILDIGIPKLGGLEVISRLKASLNSPRILVLTSQSPGIFSERCKQAGASGFMYKADDLRGLKRAIESVMEGYSYFPDLPSMSVRASDAVDEVGLLQRLSSREMSVFQQLAMGSSNKEIGESMSLSNKTISTYKARIFEKLNVTSVVEAAEFARRHYLV